MKIEYVHKIMINGWTPLKRSDHLNRWIIYNPYTNNIISWGSLTCSEKYIQGSRKKDIETLFQYDTQYNLIATQYNVRTSFENIYTYTEIQPYIGNYIMGNHTGDLDVYDSEFKLLYSLSNGFGDPKYISKYYSVCCDVRGSIYAYADGLCVPIFEGLCNRSFIKKATVQYNEKGQYIRHWCFPTTYCGKRNVHICRYKSGIIWTDGNECVILHDMREVHRFALPYINLFMCKTIFVIGDTLFIAHPLGYVMYGYDLRTGAQLEPIDTNGINECVCTMGNQFVSSEDGNLRTVLIN
jgi:hypothetical protein